MRKILTVLLILVLSAVFFGCGKANPNSGNSANSGPQIKGDPLTVISTAVKNLKQSTNFKAKKTLTVKINGQQTRVRVTDLITNSSSLFSVNAVEMSNGNQRTVFKRVHLKNVQYEYDPNSGEWKTIDKEKRGFNFTYDYYEINRNLALDLIQEIYSPSENKFGKFVKNVVKKGTKVINGIKTVEYDYSYSFEDKRRIGTENGKIFIGEVNGKLYPIEVIDDYNVKLKNNGTRVENITQVVISDIGNAPHIAMEQ